MGEIQTWHSFETVEEHFQGVSFNKSKFFGSSLSKLDKKKMEVDVNKTNDSKLK